MVREFLVYLFICSFDSHLSTYWNLCLVINDSQYSCSFVMNVVCVYGVCGMASLFGFRHWLMCRLFDFLRGMCVHIPCVCVLCVGSSVFAE